MSQAESPSKADISTDEVAMEDRSSQSGQSQAEPKVSDHDESAGEPPKIARTRLVAILAILWTGALLVALDGTMLATITATVAGSFGEFSRIAWVSTTYAMGASISQPLSGHLTDVFGRRAGLLVSYALFAVDILLALFCLRLPAPPSSPPTRAPASPPPAPQKKRVDYLGCLCVLLTMVFLQLALNDGGNDSNWASGLVASSFVIAGGSAVLLVYWDTRRAVNPVLPFRHLLQRTIAASQLSFFFNSMSVAIVIYYVPMYLEIVKGATASESGMHFVTYSVAFGIASCVVGISVKKLGRYYHANIVVQACTLTGTACICFLTATTPGWNTYVYLATSGAGYGGAYVTRLMGLLSAADPDSQAVLQAASWTINSSGNSIGIAIASSIFRNLYTGPLNSLLQDGYQNILASLLEGNFGDVYLLPADVKNKVIHVYLDAIRATFYTAMGLAVLASGSSFCMQDNRL